MKHYEVRWDEHAPSWKDEDDDEAVPVQRVLRRFAGRPDLAYKLAEALARRLKQHPDEERVNAGHVIRRVRIVRITEDEVA